MLVSFLDLDVLEMSSGIHQKACILRYLFHDCIRLMWQDHPGNISGLTSTYGSLAATVVAIWKQWECVHCIPTLFWLQPKGFCQAAKTDKPHPLVIPRSLAHRSKYALPFEYHIGVPAGKKCTHLQIALIL
ncbi:hypothetical protein ATANTOWER_003315 [Ataeniobius toweri]|uniref:Uncharacterized protein n=1 Tax=Ataeniobius toweri TaxID=208326 RepID=A0ABU7ANP2_9TELE|nr:hypothetical protein [Ataeniobius toweri]